MNLIYNTHALASCTAALLQVGTCQMMDGHSVLVIRNQQLTLPERLGSASISVMLTVSIIAAMDTWLAMSMRFR
jgi:hypothetical protein